MSGNTFGRLFTVTTFGESHGPALGCIVDGCPPGLELSEQDIQPDLERRRTGTSRHTSQRKEPDQVRILSGVFEGRTTGTPIGLLIENEDQRSRDYEKIKDRFRPGHADYTYQQKYGFRDYRGGGRSSARETVMRVAAGAIARKYLRERLGVAIQGYLAQLGPLQLEPKSLDGVYDNPFFCPDPSRLEELEAYMIELRRSGDSVGARVNVIATGVPPGLGEPVFDRLDADIALRDDEHQRGQGRGDRRGLRGRRAEGQPASRRDDAARASCRTTPAACSAAFPPARTSWSASRSSRPRASRFPAARSTSRARASRSSRPAATIPVSVCARRRSPRQCSRWC